MKALFKDSSFIVQLMVVICLFSLGGVIATGLTGALSLQSNLRLAQLLQVLCVFILPSLACAWLFSDCYKDYLQMNFPLSWSLVTWTMTATIVALPFMNFTYSLNKQMVLPEALRSIETWMQTMEEMAMQLTEKMLYTHSFVVLLLNILIVCVLTGIGEEFLFRGVLQKVFGKIIHNPHVVIWVVAFIFSALHLQFYGFITRFLLGGYLGYLLYYTQTIWIPVVAHFTNNLVGVIAFFIYQDRPEEAHAIDDWGAGSTWWLAIVSAALFGYCFYRIRHGIASWRRR
ncbi:MAG: CPBP family intramembrane metalloprotease [Dysgonamonadaceae bacterium]|nr:CPBP family intramembrane metalloprotease [Dysgonamonadaceae bacterium]